MESAFNLFDAAVDENRIPPITAATGVWSFAMTVLEIITGRVPFAYIGNDALLVMKVAAGSKPARVTHCLFSVKEMCPTLEIYTK